MPKITIFAQQGRLVAPYGTTEGHMGPLGHAKFHANRCTGNFPHLGRVASGAPIGVKFRMTKRTHMPLGCAKFQENSCNESPMAENADYWLLSKSNTGSLPQTNIHTNTTFSRLQPARVLRSSPNFAR